MILVKRTLLLLLMGLNLAGCSHEQENMQAQLDSIRILVKQSAVLATQAVCASPESRPDMIRASITMLRRAMGGPEMAKIHDMMGQMPDMAGGSMVGGSMVKQSTMKADVKHTGSTRMQMHVAIHDAGEDVFELLDALGGDKSPDCLDVQPAQLAAAAALMREHAGPSMDRVQQQLDKDSKHFLRSDIPDPVWQLAQSLARI